MKKLIFQQIVIAKIALIAMIILVGTSIFMPTFTPSFCRSEPSLVKLLLTPHDPIRITSDSELEVFNGSGTAEDPYIIEGYNITSLAECGIFIIGTTKFFSISNCYIDAKTVGIDLYYVAPGTATVINNTCVNNDVVGIALVNVGYASITNNTCINNGNGLIIHENSNAVNVNNNDFSNNEGEGISIRDSDSLTITNNICNNNKMKGIYAYDSDSSTFVNNTCNFNFNDDGIRLHESDSSTIANNTCNFNDDGICLYESDSSTIANNTCNNNKKGISVYDSRFSIVSNNTCNFNEYAILIVYDSYHPTLPYPGYATVRDNICSNNDFGIWLDDADDSVLTGNRCSENNKGIYLLHSSYSTVTNNTCNDNDQGLILDNSGVIPVVNNSFYNNNRSIVIYNSGSTTLTNNTMIKGGLAVWDNSCPGYLSQKFTKDSNWVNGRPVGYFTNLNDLSFNTSVYGQLFFINCKDITVSNQNFTDVTTGILLAYSDSCRVENSLFAENVWGTYLDHTLSTTLTNNSYKNNNYGVFLRDSDSNILTYNHFEENEQYGVYLDSASSNNLIHHNAFIDNNPEGTSQAYDGGTDNLWYEKRKGNYWSDYEKGDYLIDGIANSTDRHPLTDIPTASTPLSSVFIVGVIILACIVSLRSSVRKKKKTTKL